MRLLIGMFGGEIIGYVGRILMHSNPFIDANFIMYLCYVTIGLTFLTTSIYLCPSRIVVIYSEEAAHFKPRTYTFFFIFCDIVSLTLQGAGGEVAATATMRSMDTLGKDLLIAGLIFQVVSLSIFASPCLDLFFRFRNAAFNRTFTSLQSSTKFRIFLFALPLATLFIYIRSCYRVVGVGPRLPQLPGQLTDHIRDPRGSNDCSRHWLVDGAASGLCDWKGDMGSGGLERRADQGGAKTGQGSGKEQEGSHQREGQ